MFKIVLLSTLLLNVLCDSNDGGKAPRLPLNDGNSIPSLGLGTFLGFDEKGQRIAKEGEIERPVTWALQSGYRLLDTASAYRNEEQVGAGVRASSVPREQIFVNTKLGLAEQRDVTGALKKSLSRLNMTYVDLYIIHFPVAYKPDFSEFDIIDYLDTWRGMEQVKKLGLAKSIGLSNFNISQIQRILDNCEIKPAVLQIEVNLNIGQEKLLEFCKKNDIVVMAYAPFGSIFSKSDRPAPRADDPALVSIADKYNKTTPQIILRYLVQRGLVPIPKSENKARIEQNIDIFNFELTSEDMTSLSKYNKDYRTVLPSFWQDHPYYPFEKKDVPEPNPFKGAF